VLFGLISGYKMGGVIHILLVIAIVVVVIQVIQGRPSSGTFGPLPEKVRHLERRRSAKWERFYRILRSVQQTGSCNGPVHYKLTERSNPYEKEKYLYRLFSASYADRRLCGL
jgi:hypothetical protein